MLDWKNSSWRFQTKTRYLTKHCENGCHLEEFPNVPVYSKKKIIEILKVSIEEFYSE